jgi:NAD(P)-dependent dehydrogenase (short-subunit alcohol dehydrogenase family)
MDEKPFAGRVAVVTGAARGLGRTHAEYLARHGAAVVVNDLETTTDGLSHTSDGGRGAVVEAIRAAGGVAIPSGDDVATPEGARHLVDTAIDEWGHVDIVINNAGIAHNSAFESMDPADYLRMISVHLHGHTFVTQAAWPHFLEQDYGRVVMTSSIAGLYGAAQNIPYSSSKMGIVGLTRALAHEADGHDIRVNAICPGAVTRMIDAVEVESDYARRVKTFMQPEKVTPLVAWLADERCPVSGLIFNVRGGLVSLVFIGETRGYFDSDLSVQSITDHFAQIADRDGYIVPENGMDSANNMLRHVGDTQG